MNNMFSNKTYSGKGWFYLLIKRGGILLLLISIVFSNILLVNGESQSAISYINSNAATAAGMYRIYDYRSGDCYVSANVYMLRRRAFLDGLDWSVIKKDTNPSAFDGGNGSVRKIAAYDADGLYNNMKLTYNYSVGNRTYNVQDANLPKTKAEKIKALCDLLDKHPEGIAAHSDRISAGYPHAVLLTHYVKDDKGVITFYAVDSAWNTFSNNTEYGGWNHPNDAGVTNINETLVGSIDYLNSYKYIATNGVYERGEVSEATTVWERLYGAGRYDTMKAIVDEGFSRIGGTVIIASGATFKDALPASGLAGLYGAPVLITDGKALSTQTKEVLKRLRPGTVFIAGGPFAVSNEVQKEIDKVTGNKSKRIMGNTASGTSANLALAGKGRWSSEGTAIIATNSSFKDALSVAPIAYAKKYPILLADSGKSLSDDVISALNTLGIKNVIIVGGEGAVTKNVERQLSKEGISLRIRLGGANGVATSAQIAKWGLSNGLSANNMGVATSQSFPDALAGAALCGYNNAILVLADDKAMLNATFPRTYKANIKRAFVFGGTSAVGTRTWNALAESVK